MHKLVVEYGYESEAMTGADDAVPVSVDVSGVEELRLVADKNGETNSDHADWGGARVVRHADPAEPDPEPEPGDAAWTTPFGYRGEYTDAETGYVYLRARYYDPEMGRFLSEDPVRDGMNWYVYAGNNPIMFVDPLGLEKIVVSGGKYSQNDDAWNYEFIETGLAKVWDYMKETGESGETVTWIIADAGWTEEQKNDFIAAVHPTRVNVQFIQNKDQLIQYINNKNVIGGENFREDDKITGITVFSHGYGTDGGSIELGHDSGSNADFSFKASDINRLDSNAFDNPRSAFYSCYSAAGDYSFAQRWVDKTGGKSWGFDGKSNYATINNGNCLESKWAHLIGTFYWGGSRNYPSLGKNAVTKSFYGG